MKKWTYLLFVAAVMLFLTANVASAQTVTPKLVLDGTVLKPASPPALIGGYTMIPIRTASENLGYKVDFDNIKKVVTVSGSSKVIKMTIGKKTATVDGSSVTLQAPPVIQSGTTLVPLRFVGESLGVKVYWDNATKTAFLYSSGSTGNGSDTGSNGGGSTNGGSTNGGSGSNAGADDDTTPPDDGLIGILPPAGEEDTNDGSVPTNPAGTLTQIHGVSFENDTVTIKYDGGVLQPMTSVLTGTDRIVVDLPSSDFATDFTPTLTTYSDGSVKRLGELAVTGHAALQKIRFSLYSDSPRTIRFVLDLNQKWGYTMTNDAAAGELKIALQPAGTTTPGQPGKSSYTIVLDAGHGGSDPGAQSLTGRWEKNFTLPVILKMRDILSADSRLNIVLTRSGDTYPTLADRYNLANSLNADLFLSVHGNSIVGKPTVTGTEVYYTRAESLDFAKAVQKYAVPAGGLKDRGIIQKSLAVTRETKMPAVLYEAGYLSNASDEKTMYTDDFQNRIAQGLATAILKYLQLA